MLEKAPQAKMSAGIRGCVRNYIIDHMLDAVSGYYKVLICDEFAATVLSCVMRVHDLMLHGVTLLEDLMAPRQPIINGPALYFFVPNTASIERVIDDWSRTDPYKEAHIFALGTTPSTCIQQLARSRLFSKLVTFKDLMVDFMAPESLVFHLNIKNDLLFFLSSRPLSVAETALDVATTRLASVFCALNDGVPVVRYQSKSRICQRFAAIFSEKVTKLCSNVAQSSISPTAALSRDNPLLIILDRTFDMTTPLVHHRTYQCLLNDLLPLENNMYKQVLTNSMGEALEKEHCLDEEDHYWSLYRHRFFSYCLREFPAALQKLCSESPSLVRGKESGVSVTELGSALRALPWFKEQETKLSLHIDICTKIMDIYKSQCLAEVCEVEQDIAAKRKTHKEILHIVRRIMKNTEIPEKVRLRLFLLLVSASDGSECTEEKLWSIIQESELANGNHLHEALKHMINFLGKTLQCSSPLNKGLEKGGSFSAPCEDGDPFVNKITTLVGSVAKNTLSTVDFPLMTSSSWFWSCTNANANQNIHEGATPKKSLRVGLSLATVQPQREHSSYNVLPNLSQFGGKISSDAIFLDVGDGNDGTTLIKSQRIVLFVIGGVTCSEMRAAYETSKQFGREVIVGGTSILQPDEFIQALEEI